MESIEERAKAYVEGCELQGKEARKAELTSATTGRLTNPPWRPA